MSVFQVILLPSLLFVLLSAVTNTEAGEPQWQYHQQLYRAVQSGDVDQTGVLLTQISFREDHWLDAVEHYLSGNRGASSLAILK